MYLTKLDVTLETAMAGIKHVTHLSKGQILKRLRTGRTSGAGFMGHDLQSSQASRSKLFILIMCTIEHRVILNVINRENLLELKNVSLIVTLWIANTEFTH